MDDFCAGAFQLRELPELRRVVWSARFLPVVERLQEGDHSLVCRGARSASRASGAYVSCILRIGEVEELFEANLAQDYSAYIGHLEDLSKADVLAKRLGFWRHPLWRRANDEKATNREKMLIAQSIMYSLDSVAQYDTMCAVAKARKKHRAVRENHAKKWRAQFQVKEAFSEAAIERFAMAEHMQARLVPGRLYSFLCLPIRTYTYL